MTTKSTPVQLYQMYPGVIPTLYEIRPDLLTETDIDYDPGV